MYNICRIFILARYFIKICYRVFALFWGTSYNHTFVSIIDIDEVSSTRARGSHHARNNGGSNRTRVIWEAYRDRLSSTFHRPRGLELLVVKIARGINDEICIRSYSDRICPQFRNGTRAEIRGSAIRYWSLSFIASPLPSNLENLPLPVSLPVLHKSLFKPRNDAARNVAR